MSTCREVWGGGCVCVMWGAKTDGSACAFLICWLLLWRRCSWVIWSWFRLTCSVCLQQTQPLDAKSGHKWWTFIQEQQRAESFKERWELTAVMESLQHFAEDAFVRLAVGMRDEHVHVAARGLPSAVGAARHRHQTRIDGQDGILHLHMTKSREWWGWFSLWLPYKGGIGKWALNVFPSKILGGWLAKAQHFILTSPRENRCFMHLSNVSHYLAAAEDRR